MNPWCRRQMSNHTTQPPPTLQTTNWTQAEQGAAGSFPHALVVTALYFGLSLRCSPCAWFWKARGCNSGFDCTYCHMCPEGGARRISQEVKAEFVDFAEGASPGDGSLCLFLRTPRKEVDQGLLKSGVPVESLDFPSSFGLWKGFAQQPRAGELKSRKKARGWMERQWVTNGVRCLLRHRIMSASDRTPLVESIR